MRLWYQAGLMVRKQSCKNTSQQQRDFLRDRLAQRWLFQISPPDLGPEAPARPPGLAMLTAHGVKPKNFPSH